MNIRIIICALAAAGMPLAEAETVEGLINDSVAAQNAGLNDIDDYMLQTRTMGTNTVDYFEKEQSLQLDNGQTVYVMRQVPLSELEQRRADGNAFADATPEELEQAADKVEEAGRMMEDGMRREMEQTGLPGGIGPMIMNPPPGKPWLSANPRDMTGMYATMLRGAAEGKRQEAARDPVADAKTMAATMKTVGQQARIAGRETIGGREAIKLEANNLNQVQIVDGQEFRQDSLLLWLDAADKLPLRMEIVGSIDDGSGTRPITIRRDDSDYKTVPGCGALKRPFKSVMTLTGMMSPQEEAELKQAQAQMADMEQQLASMPPAQRAMIEQQMGPQMKMLENMSAGGGLTIVSEVVELKCNTGPPDPLQIAQITMGTGTLGGAAAAGGAVVRTPPAANAAAVEPTADQSAAAKTASQQACLQQKIAEKQASQKTKRGLGSLMSAVTRTAAQFGNQDVGQAVGEIYEANASVEDLNSAARDLGITEDEIAACSQ